MNLEQLKAKYGKGTSVVTTAAVNTAGVAGKAWNTTKTTAVKTGGFIKDVAPATNRRVNSIAAELNAKYNNHDIEITKNRILIEMIADATGINIPDESVLEDYALQLMKEKEEENKQQDVAETLVEAESIDNTFASKLTDTILGAIKAAFNTTKEEEEITIKAPKKEKPAPKKEVVIEEEEQESLLSTKNLKPKKEETKADEEGPKKPKRKVGKMGRQAPLAE